MNCGMNIKLRQVIYKHNNVNMVSVMGKRGLFLVWLCLVNILPGMAQTEKLIDYVNPFVGTDGYGNV